MFRADFKKIVKQKGNQDDLKCKKTLFTESFQDILGV